MAEYSGNEVPLVPGGLRVYREWVILPSGMPKAVAWPTVWLPGINTATCERHELHEAPFAGCTCGFYGKYQHVGIGSYANGVAELSGRVILGTKGARAQFARIVAMNIGELRKDEQKRLKENYPDVTWFLNTKTMLKKYPPQDVSELVPEELQGDGYMFNGSWVSITRFNGPASSGFASPPISISDLTIALRKLMNQ